MPTRNKAEKKKIERRSRLERIIVPVVFVVGIAAFIAVSIIIGGKSQPIEPSSSSSTPEPDLCAAAADALSDKLGGEVTYGDKQASLSFTSSADGAKPVFTAYMKNGVLCVRITRDFAFSNENTTPKPDATEDLFGETPGNASSGSDNEKNIGIASVAGEICDCICCVYEPDDPTSSAARIEEILRSFADGTLKKANMVFGVYLVEFKYSETDGILSVVCEPA